MYKPKLIELENQCTSYPIGRNIQDNMLGILDYQKAIIDTFGEDGRKINLICMGSSGAIIAGIVASGIPNSKITFVKKEGVSSHDSLPELELYNKFINIIIDDFFVTGNTLINMYNSVCVSGDTSTIDMLVISNPKYQLTDELSRVNNEDRVQSLTSKFISLAKPTHITHI